MPNQAWLGGLFSLNLPPLFNSVPVPFRPDLMNVTVTNDGVLPQDDPFVAPLLKRGVVQQGFRKIREVTSTA